MKIKWLEKIVLLILTLGLKGMLTNKNPAKFMRRLKHKILETKKQCKTRTELTSSQTRSKHKIQVDERYNQPEIRNTTILV